MVTVRECLKLKAFKGEKILSGESGLDRAVSSVSVLEVSEIDNEIVITAFYSIKYDIEKQCNTIKTLDRKVLECDFNIPKTVEILFMHKNTISCVFSSVRSEHEYAVAEIAKEVLGDEIHISLSSEIGSLSLIERENGCILNAMLHEVSKSFTEGFYKRLKD